MYDRVTYYKASLKVSLCLSVLFLESVAFAKSLSTETWGYWLLFTAYSLVLVGNYLHGLTVAVQNLAHDR